MDLTPKAKEGELFKFPHPEAQKRHLAYDPSAHKRLIESTLSTLAALERKQFSLYPESINKADTFEIL